MKRNGGRGRRFHQVIAFQRETRAMGLPVRLGSLAWLRRWVRRPRRVFWELDPVTGEWRRL